jgi:hypothetical protein
MGAGKAVLTLPEPGTVTEPTARELIHAAIDRYLDFHEREGTEGLMVVEIPLAKGKPRRFEVQTVDRRTSPSHRALTPRRA